MHATMTHSSKQYGRAAVFAAAILAAAALAACGPESSAVGTADRTFAVSGPVRLELENGSGDSRITVGSPGEVRVHAEFRVHGWPWEDPQRKLKEIAADPPFSQESNLIRIGHGGWEMNSVSADYSISVPPETEMRGVAGSGNLDVNGIAGPANFVLGSGNLSAAAIGNDTRAMTGSGDITLTDIQGQIEVTAGSGNIVIHGAKDEVRTRTGSGNIRIERPGGNVVAATGSGNVEVRDAAADVRVHAASGEITVDGNPSPTSFWDIRASSGDVTLHVPANASFRFSGRSSSGDINVGVPSVTEGVSGKHDYQARIGDGKARVEIETSSGDISLR